MENAIAVTRNKQELERLEGIIQKNIGAFYEVGRALMAIRDGQLYRDVLGFETFEAYCKSKWDFSDRYARYILASTKVVQNISTGTIVPVTESQARPLSKLEPDQQRAAWKQAVETAPEGKVTSSLLWVLMILIPSGPLQ